MPSAHSGFALNPAKLSAPRSCVLPRGDALPLAVVLIAAAALRLVALGQAPLWEDEAATAGFAGLSWNSLFHGVGTLEPNPPAFYALEHLWTALAGTSPWALRLPSALAGIATVTVLWRLAHHAFGPRAALWAAGLAATAPQLLEFSREARVYPMLVLAVAIATLAATRVATGIGRAWPNVALLAVASGGALLLHHTGVVADACVFLAGGVIAWQAGAPRLPRLARLAGAGVAALVIGAPSLLAMAAIAADAANNTAWIPVPGLAGSIATALSVWLAPFDGLRLLHPGFGLAALGLALPIAAAALLGAASRARLDPVAAGLLAGLLAAQALMAGISQRTPILLERTLLFSLVFFLPLLGASLATARPPFRAVLLAALLLVQAPAFAALYAPTRHDEDWPTLAATVQAEHARTGWPVIAIGAFSAVALDRALPGNDPADTAIVLISNTGARLQVAATRAMTAATPLTLDAPLCATLHAGGALLVHRVNPATSALEPRIAATLTAAGGTPGPVTSLGGITLERWPGVCPPSRG